ncbi:MAG TPA: cytochrome P460 family protein [Povalibacter sp.]|nr:cytochrome P460 family protein [Povalibacter sp.]
MNKHNARWSLVPILSLLALQAGLAQSTAATDGPQFTPEGQLVRPADYREWVTIGTGLSMAYGPVRDALPAGERPFTNVFVNPSSYRAFLRTGRWPDKTIFVLEIRGSVAVNKAANGANGLFQGELHGIEAEVKDETRFPGQWGFFGLDPSRPTGQQIPVGASCYQCHAKNAAVENTFVQFYPVLRDIARENQTFKNVPETF